MIEAIPLQTLAALRDAVGEELPPTPWVEIDQSRVDTFADATDDHQWIHVDPVQAAAGPYGGTIAHGFLTLALLAPFFNQVLDPADADVRVNYGFDKVRFTAPVPVGSRVRGRLRLEQFAPRGEMLEARTHAEVEVSGRPALIAEMIILFHPAEAAETAEEGAQ
jgi:acyl dehydratase